MSTTPNETHPLLTVPFNVDTDFTVLAEHCKNFAETIAEDPDPVLAMALCGRLNACLTLLQPTLLEPIPPHLIESLTVDTPPDSYPCFIPDASDLCHYCTALTQVLMGQGLSAEIRSHLSCLLSDLTGYFADEMQAPRWLRTAEGMEVINPVMH